MRNNSGLVSRMAFQRLECGRGQHLLSQFLQCSEHKKRLLKRIIMTFLFVFNPYIVAPIIIDWLSLSDFALLDSALCNTYSRAKYFDVCSRFPQLVQRGLLQKENGLPLSFTMLHWRLRRGIDNWTGSVAISDSFLRNAELLYVIDSWFSLWSKNQLYQSCLENACRYIRRIHVEYCPSSYSSALCRVLRHCISLEDFYLGQLYLVDDVVQTLADSCPNLVKVTINCNFDMKAKTIMNLVHNCSKLTEFQFPGICRLSKSFMAKYDIHSLVHLLFFIDIGPEYLVTPTRSTNLTAFRPRFFTQSEFRFFLLNGGGSSLTKIDLSLVSHPAGSFLHLLGPHCPNLTDLFMPEDRSTEVYFAITIASMQKLEVLNVTKLRIFGAAAIEALGRHCPCLTDLSLNTGLPEIGMCLPNLKSLFITFNFMVITTLLREDLNTILCKCRHLTHLSIPVVDDSMLSMIATYCTDLEVLHVTSQRIGYYAADCLAKRLPNLRELTLDACVVSGVVRTFLSNCFKLTLLSFEEDCLFSMHDFWSIIDLCSHLRELRVTSFNLHMNADVIKEIVRRLKNLRRLSVKAYRLYEWDRKWFHRQLESINPDLRFSLHYMHWVGDASVSYALQHYV